MNAHHVSQAGPPVVPVVCAALLAAALAFLAAATPALAFPRLPASFWGGVINSQSGNPAPAGLTVTAVAGNLPVGQTTTFSSGGSTFYRLDVAGDDPDTTQKEGPREGESFSIVVDGGWTITAVWRGGSDSRLDLRWIVPPSLNDGPAAPASPAAQGASQPVQPAPPPTLDFRINIIGTAQTFPIDSQGRLRDKASVTVAGGGVTLSLLPGTKLTGADGASPATGVTIQPLSSVPPLPVRLKTIGQALDIGPAGIKFDRPATLVLGYKASQLPVGAVEKSLSAVTWNGQVWETVKGTLDTAAKTVTMEIDRPGIYGLAAWIPETAPAAPPAHDHAPHALAPPKPAPTGETIVIPTATAAPPKPSAVKPRATPAPEEKPAPAPPVAIPSPLTGEGQGEGEYRPGLAPAARVTPPGPALPGWLVIGGIMAVVAAGLLAWRIFFHVPGNAP